jgi:hypothetical protein
MGVVIDFAAWKERRAAKRAWDLAWVELELRELDLMVANARGCLSMAESETERDRHYRFLSRLGAQRAVYLEQQRRLSGGRRG